MTYDDVSFPGLERIPDMMPVNDANGETIYLRTAGVSPIIICAPHSGVPATTPTLAQSFGRRVLFDPVTGKEIEPQDDTNTLKITFGIVRALASLGFTPHAFINLVSRKFVDMNRGWSGQQSWRDTVNEYLPSDIDKTPEEFPRVDEFNEFKQVYYDHFHDAMREVTSALHPDGWLFEVHGQSFEGAELIVFSGYGYYARQDFVHAGASSLHRCLADEGFALIPTAPGAAGEIRREDGSLVTNLISGGRYGARFFDPSRDAVPYPGNVVPNQPRRVHGIQFELSRSRRFNQPDEALESTGLAMGYAIYRCLLGNGLIARAPTPREGENSSGWYALLG